MARNDFESSATVGDASAGTEQFTLEPGEPPVMEVVLEILFKRRRSGTSAYQSVLVHADRRYWITAGIIAAYISLFLAIVFINISLNSSSARAARSTMSFSVYRDVWEPIFPLLMYGGFGWLGWRVAKEKQRNALGWAIGSVVVRIPALILLGVLPYRKTEPGDNPDVSGHDDLAAVPTKAPIGEGR
jgi:hypothetical protein